MEKPPVAPAIAKVWVLEVEPFRDVMATVRGATPFEMPVILPYASTVVEAYVYVPAETVVVARFHVN